MADLFSHEWMKAFGELWNADAEIVNGLAKIHFNSVIGYGFEDQDKPSGILVVQEGKVVFAGAYDGQSLNWIYAPIAPIGKSGRREA